MEIWSQIVIEISLICQIISLRSRRLYGWTQEKTVRRARRRHARGEGAPAKKAPENRFPPPLFSNYLAAVAWSVKSLCRRSLPPRVSPSRAPVFSWAHYFQLSSVRFFPPSFRSNLGVLVFVISKIKTSLSLLRKLRPPKKKIRKTYMTSNYDRSKTIIRKTTKNYHLRDNNPLLLIICRNRGWKPLPVYNCTLKICLTPPIGLKSSLRSPRGRLVASLIGL